MRGWTGRGRTREIRSPGDPGPEAPGGAEPGTERAVDLLSMYTDRPRKLSQCGFAAVRVAGPGVLLGEGGGEMRQELGHRVAAQLGEQRVGEDERHHGLGDDAGCGHRG